MHLRFSLLAQKRSQRHIFPFYIERLRLCIVVFHFRFLQGIIVCHERADAVGKGEIELASPCGSKGEEDTIGSPEMRMCREGKKGK